MFKLMKQFLVLVKITFQQVNVAFMGWKVAYHTSNLSADSLQLQLVSPNIPLYCLSACSVSKLPIRMQSKAFKSTHWASTEYIDHICIILSIFWVYPVHIQRWYEMGPDRFSVVGLITWNSPPSDLHSFKPETLPTPHISISKLIFARVGTGAPLSMCLRKVL